MAKFSPIHSWKWGFFITWDLLNNYFKILQAKRGQKVHESIIVRFYEKKIVLEKCVNLDTF